MGRSCWGFPISAGVFSGADAEGKGRSRYACTIMGSSEGDGGDKDADGPRDFPKDQGKASQDGSEGGTAPFRERSARELACALNGDVETVKGVAWTKLILRLQNWDSLVDLIGTA